MEGKEIDSLTSAELAAVQAGIGLDDTKTDETHFWSARKIISNLSSKIDNNKTNSTITNYNDCPIGFVSMPGNATNSPSEARTYVLTQAYNNNQNYKSQVVTVLNSTDVFVRYYNNGTWSSWDKLTTETRINSILSIYPKTEQTVSCPKGTSTITLETNSSYLLTSSASNYWKGAYIVCQGWSDTTLINKLIGGSDVVLTSTTFKTITVTNSSKGEISFKITRL